MEPFGPFMVRAISVFVWVVVPCYFSTFRAVSLRLAHSWPSFSGRSVSNAGASHHGSMVERFPLAVLGGR